MSDLTFNKFAGAGLAAFLAIVGLHEVSGMLFEKEPPEKPGMVVAVAEGEGGEAAAPAGPPDWGTVLPTADVAAGMAVSGKCKTCHSFDPGGAPGPSAPNLYGVIGRKPGTGQTGGGFTGYSAAMTELGGRVPAWDYDHLNEFVTNPRRYLDGTKMGFAGLSKVEDRVNLIAYLRSLSPSPAPIPAPKPAAAPAAAAPAEGAAPATSAAGAAPAAPAAAAPAAPAPAAPPAK